MQPSTSLLHALDFGERIESSVSTPGGRLSLATGTPIPTSDLTGISTIYYPYFHGDRIWLYDGSRLVLRTIASEPSVAVPSTIFRGFDVWMYDNAGTPALETLDWNQTTAAITNATNATPIVITSNGHGLANGNQVGIAGIVGNTAPNGKIWFVRNVAANTFELENSAGNGAYVSGGNWYKMNGLTRATALAYQNGFLSKSGDATRLYLGSGCTIGTSGQCDDAVGRRFLDNYYHRIRRAVRVIEPTDSWNYSTATIRMVNGSRENIIEVFLGVADRTIDLRAIHHGTNTTAGQAVTTLIGVNDSTAAAPGELMGTVNVHSAGNLMVIVAELCHAPAIGYTAYTWLERAGGTATGSFRGDAGIPTFMQSGLNGVIEN